MVQPKTYLNGLTLDTVNYSLKRGQKRYEMSNHLGNVLAVVSDKIIGSCSNDSIRYFSAEVIYAYDYSPFGAILPGRSYAADSTCRMVDNYDTIPNTDTLFNLSLFMFTTLSPGDQITISDGTTTYPLVNYNPGYFLPDQYAADAALVLNGFTGVSASSSGGGVFIIMNSNTSDFNCGETITIDAGSAGNSSTFIDCSPDIVYNPIQVCDPTDYRFGCNGMEKDDEVSGTGHSHTAEFWQYDSRLGRRWNLDPIIKYWESPYAAFANNPIWLGDPNGADTIQTPRGTLMNAGTGYKSALSGYFLVGEGLKTKVWDPLENAGQGGYIDYLGTKEEMYQVASNLYQFEKLIFTVKWGASSYEEALKFSEWNRYGYDPKSRASFEVAITGIMQYIELCMGAELGAAET